MPNSKIRFATSLVVFTQLSPLGLAHADGLFDRAKKALGVTVTRDGKNSTRVSLGQPGFLNGLTGTQPDSATRTPPSTRKQPTAMPAALPTETQPEPPTEQTKPLVVPAALTGTPIPPPTREPAPDVSAAVEEPKGGFPMANGWRLVGVKTCDLGQVNWKNITLRNGRRTRAFKNGTAKELPEERDHHETYALENVDFADVDHDGRVEAYLHLIHEDYYFGEFERTSEDAYLLVIDTTAACQPRVLGEFNMLYSFVGNERGHEVGNRFVVEGDTETVQYGWQDGVLAELERKPSKPKQR